ncbi:MAG: phytanoyl-CoA dioxygenase family protein [Proteobacteria bacterium]|nr:phytanoyl-CoA dioxygenase family protein [Pseudomonadota bacterium]
MSLDLDRDGAQRYEAVLNEPTLELLCSLADANLAKRPGARLFGAEALRPLLAPNGLIGALAAPRLGRAVRAVRAVVFDKSEVNNWAVAWHQDRTIAVEARRDVEGFGPWSTKAGVTHVAPPFALLERMLTLRIHLDPCPVDNAPLLIAPGSHLLGRVAASEAAGQAERLGSAVCLAGPGDVWVYATPILHASDRAAQPRRRRVLQVDFSADALPGGLAWLGV